MHWLFSDRPVGRQSLSAPTSSENKAPVQRKFCHCNRKRIVFILAVMTTLATSRQWTTILCKNFVLYDSAKSIFHPCGE
jgi:hypothetical protein